MWTGSLGQTSIRAFKSGEILPSELSVQHAVQRPGDVSCKSLLHSWLRHSGTGLENRSLRKETQGSNPCLSAERLLKGDCWCQQSPFLHEIPHFSVARFGFKIRDHRQMFFVARCNCFLPLR